MTNNIQHKLLLLKIFHEKLNNFLYKVDVHNIDENDLNNLNEMYSLISTYNNNSNQNNICKSNKSINRLSSIDFMETMETIDINDELISTSDIYVTPTNKTNKFIEYDSSNDSNESENEHKLMDNKFMYDATITLDDINDEPDESVMMLIESILDNSIYDVYIPIRDNPCCKTCSYNDSNFSINKLVSLNLDI